MGIKVIDELPRTEKNERMEQLKANLREIIEKRIPVCEITDPPYPNSVMRERLLTAIRKTIWEYAEKDKYGHKKVPVVALDIHSRTIEGKKHWYITFDVNKWTEEWERFREENR